MAMALGDIVTVSQYLMVLVIPLVPISSLPAEEKVVPASTWRDLGGGEGGGWVGIARRGKGGEEGLLKVEGCYRGRIIACRGRTRWC